MKATEITFSDILNYASKYRPIDKDKLLQEWKERKTGPVMKDILDKWVNSLSTSPDFSVYDLDEYLIETYDCFKIYSRDYIRAIKSLLGNDNDIHNILDVGCGLGITTLFLAENFENANIFGTNIKDTIQYKIDLDVVSNCNRCHIVEEADFNENIDVIFASEFFEHLQEPVDYIVHLINKFHPKYIVCANTFTNMAIGHFYTYKYANREYVGKQMSKVFNDTVKNLGYVEMETNFWNHRPKVFKKSNIQMGKLI